MEVNSDTDGAVDGAVDRAVDGTVDGTVDGAVDGALAYWAAKNWPLTLEGSLCGCR